MEQVPQAFLDVMLALARIGTAFLMLPFMEQQLVSPFARLLLAVPFSYFLVASGTVGGFAGDWFILITKEVLIGMLLGFVWSLPFYALEIVGHLIDFQTGLTFTQTVDPFSGNQSAVTSTMLTRVFSMLFIASGGFFLLLDALFLSYRIWPATDIRPHLSPATLAVLLQEHNGLFSVALLLAAPVMVTLLLLDFAAGIIGKSAPNLHFQEFTLPAKIWLAWFVLLLSLPYVHTKLMDLLPVLARVSRQVLAP